MTTVAAALLASGCMRGADEGQPGATTAAAVSTAAAEPTPLELGEVLERFTARGVVAAQAPAVEEGQLQEAWRWDGPPPLHSAAGLVRAGETGLGFQRLDLDDGEPLWTVLREGEIATYLSGGMTPDLVVALSLVAPGVETTDGICAFDASTGESLWCAAETSFEGWSATRPDDLLARRTAEGDEAFVVLDGRTGEQRLRVDVQDAVANVSRPTADRVALQLVSGDVVVVDLDDGSAAVTVQGATVTSPVAADATATYHLRLGILTAYDDSGAEVWAWRSTLGFGSAEVLLPMAGGVLMITQSRTGLVVDGELVWEVEGQVQDIARVGDRGTVLVALGDDTAALLDVASGAELTRLPDARIGTAEGVLYRIDGEEVMVIDVLTGEERGRITLPEVPDAVFVTGFGDGLLVFGDPYTGFTFLRRA